MTYNTSGMKLVYKNIIINTIASIVILFAGEYSLYFFLKNNIEKETIEHLHLERYFMMKDIKNGVDINYFKHNVGDALSITPIKKVIYTDPVIEDEFVEEVEEEFEHEHEGRMEEEKFTSKKIVFDVEQNQKAYRVSITKTIDEDEGLYGSMSAIIFVSAFCMLIILVSMNVFVYYRLFSPLRLLIKDVKSFSIQKLQKISPPKTSTTEFVTLGKEISKMSEKMISDYGAVKEFMENMTHEVQTPLAVINSKIERCLQDENLSEEQAILLSDAAKSVNKLFHINKGLTLLSKLENKQFNNAVDINLKALIQERINYFSDFIENKNITLSQNYEEDITIVMKLSLAEILIDNLIKNAIQHNHNNGSISISIEKQKLKIANTGDTPKAPTTAYFDRFYSQKPHQSLGLGLSIIKKIVEYYSYKISYAYQDDMHTVTIDFSKEIKTV